LVGRTQAYKAILQGSESPQATVPESFKLLVRELNGLAIGIEALGAEEAEPAEEVEEVPQELVITEEEKKSLMQEEEE
jgi:DNA-directed RNA polymerase subunit beta